MYGNLGFDPSWGAFFGFPWVILTFYAIARYSLFDTRLIVSRSLSIVLLLLIFSGIQIGLFKADAFPGALAAGLHARLARPGHDGPVGT